MKSVSFVTEDAPENTNQYTGANPITKEIIEHTEDMDSNSIEDIHTEDQTDVIIVPNQDHSDRISNNHCENTHDALQGQQEIPETPPSNVVARNKIKLFEWPAMWSFIMTRGTQRLTRNQFKSVRSFIRCVLKFVAQNSNSATIYSDFRMPAYETITRQLKEGELSKFLVKMDSIECPVNLRKSGARVSRNSSSLPTTAETATIYKACLTDFIKMEAASPQFMRRLVGSSSSCRSPLEMKILGLDGIPSIETRRCVDDIPIVKGRNLFFGGINFMQVKSNGTEPYPCAEAGDTIHIHLVLESEFGEDLNHQFTLRVDHQTDLTVLEGVIEFFFTCSQNSEDLADENSDNIICKALQDKLLKSPHDRELLLQPSDIVAVISPTTGRTSSSSSSDSRILLVSRIILLEDEERSSFCLFLPDVQKLIQCIDHPVHAFRNLERSRTELRRDVSHVELAHRHQNARLSQRCTPTSSVGILSNGEHYGVYRLMLYWDGFQPNAAKSDSMEGIYGYSLNMATHGLHLNDILTFALAPPGVDINDALNSFIPEIVKLSTEGVLVTDAFGYQRRFFLDLVGFLADTPAINSTLDVLGHNANACCHLCTFFRGEDKVHGARYCSLKSNAANLSSTRTFSRMKAAREYQPQNERLNILGLKKEAATLNRFGIKLANSLRLAKNYFNQCFERVVPCMLDPYRGSFVAPDHLLCGLTGDAITLSFRLLPSKEYRKLIETELLKNIKYLGLSYQNKIFNDEGRQRGLMSKSMSQVYDLLAVAEISFTNIIPSNVLETNCLGKSFHIVGLLSEMVGVLWNRERNCQGRPIPRDYITRFQKLVSDYLNAVSDICSIPDEHAVVAVEQNEENDIEGLFWDELTIAATAKRTVDKPNCHRLFEFSTNTLPYFGDASCIAELPLERNHQFLKRAYNRSNHKEAHLQTMENISFNDWQRRAHSTGINYRDGGLIEKLACARVISGRQDAILSRSDVNELVNVECESAFGPDSIVLDELRSQIISYNDPVLRSNEKGSHWILGPEISRQKFEENHGDAVRGIMSSIKQMPGLGSASEDSIHFYEGARKQHSGSCCWNELNIFDVVSRGEPYTFGQVLAVIQARLDQSCSVPLLHIRQMKPEDPTAPLQTRVYEKVGTGICYNLELCSDVIKHPTVIASNLQEERNVFILTAKNAFPPRRA